MAYHVTKDLKAEVKVSGSLFLKDLLILVLYPTIMWFFTGGLVADTLKIPYIIYNVLVILVLLQRPASNPGKQVWQVCVPADGGFTDISYDSPRRREGGSR